MSVVLSAATGTAKLARVLFNSSPARFHCASLAAMLSTYNPPPLIHALSSTLLPFGTSRSHS
eukprot:31425-Pelagococcus_subviridis.AAC.8